MRKTDAGGAPIGNGPDRVPGRRVCADSVPTGLVPGLGASSLFCEEVFLDDA